jgi:hypothetical protein
MHMWIKTKKPLQNKNKVRKQEKVGKSAILENS